LKIFIGLVVLTIGCFVAFHFKQIFPYETIGAALIYFGGLIVGANAK